MTCGPSLKVLDRHAVKGHAPGYSTQNKLEDTVCFASGTSRCVLLDLHHCRALSKWFTCVFTQRSIHVYPCQHAYCTLCKFASAPFHANIFMLLELVALNTALDRNLILTGTSTCYCRTICTVAVWWIGLLLIRTSAPSLQHVPTSIVTCQRRAIAIVQHSNRYKPSF